MDMDYPIDLPEVIDMIDRSRVLVVRFSTFSRRLLLDFRHTPQEGPVIRIVRRARSAEERFRQLARLRPGLDLPDEIVTFQWPNPVSSFRRLGVLDRVVLRFGTEGFPEMEGACQTMFERMLVLEQEELKAAVRGEGYNALWKRTSPEAGTT